MTSPYEGISEDKWKAKTEELINQHPLEPENIRDIALTCWNTLWRTTIGEGELTINLSELDVPATVVGYFFEKLFAKDLEKLYPTQWRGGKGKDDKDIVYIENKFYSVEIKTSGQLGAKIFGNRSYSQVADDSELVKKEKSGYYITVNFYKKSLNLIRFGWIDHSDWKGQTSQTGQASTLKNEVYEYKLISVPGDYRLDAPVAIIPGVGEKKVNLFAQAGVITLRDLKQYTGTDTKIIRFRDLINDI